MCRVPQDPPSDEIRMRKCRNRSVDRIFSAHSSNPSRRIGVSHLPSYVPTCEPNVGRRPLASFHVLTVLLAALLAWPWNVILSAAEAFQISNQSRSSTVHPPVKLRLHR